MAKINNKITKNKKINFTPLNDQMLIRVDVPTVVMEDSEPPKSGEVLVLGEGNDFRVKVGDRVFWNYGGREIELDGERFIVLHENELLGYQR